MSGDGRANKIPGLEGDPEGVDDTLLDAIKRPDLSVVNARQKLVERGVAEAIFAAQQEGTKMRKKSRGVAETDKKLRS